MSDDTASAITKKPQWHGPRTIKLSKLISKKNANDGKVALDDTGENYEYVAVKTPSIEGEESVSGSEPVPGSDADMLANAQTVGEQLTENSEHPKEVDIARDVNAAQKALTEK